MVELVCFISKVQSEWNGYCLYEHIYERWMLKEANVFVARDWFGRKGHGNDSEWLQVIKLDPGDLFFHVA